MLSASRYISGNGFPRPGAILGSSPTIILDGGNWENRPERWEVLSLKFVVVEDVASAMCTGGEFDAARDRLLISCITPGSGCVFGNWGR